MKPLLLAQLNSYEYLRSNPAFCEELKKKNIEFGMTVHACYVRAVAPDYIQQYGFVPACVTNDFAKRIQSYLAFCEMWTSEHI